MILGKFQLCALGALLAGLAAPSIAEQPASVPTQSEATAAGPQRADASRSRRVELPFPLQPPADSQQQPRPAPRTDDAPHPFRETLLKRAAFTAPSGPETYRDRSLSHIPDFS